MIKGTNADCKVLKVSVSETTATITLLIFATVATVPSKSFRFYIKDAESNTKTQVNNYVYWVDRINNYNYDANNIDTNKYKEVILNIDITNGNKAKISESRWHRSCYILLCDTSKITDNVAWSSSKLDLVSDEFEIPEVKNLQFKPAIEAYDEQNQRDLVKIGINFKLDFRSEKDFNYNNKNFLARLNIRSVTTDKVLESKLIAQSTNIYNEVVTNNYYQYGEWVVIEICITDNKDNVFYRVRKQYRIRKKFSKNAYVKTKDGIRKVFAFFVATDSETEHEGEWL